MSSEIKPFYEFKDFRFDAEKKVLWRDGEMVNLTPKAGEVLLLLVESRGNLVERDEILDKVWPGTFVEEGNLNHAISALRKVLGNESIQTIPRRGYRFKGEVREIIEGKSTDVLIHRHTVSETLIEEQETFEDEKTVARRTGLPPAPKIQPLYFILGLALVLALIGGLIWHFRPDSDQNLSAARHSVKTIAILPPQSLNQQNEDGLLSFGITENLASRLGSLDRLVVRPTNSVKKLAETENDPLEVGRKLKTDIVMVGNFQRADGRIRMTVRLLNVTDGSQIWAGNFDEVEQDIFKLQDSLSAQAAKYLIDRLTPQEQEQFDTRPTADLEAYKLYLRGRHAWNKRTPEGFAESIRAYQEALDRDPTFATAYAGLADSYVLLNDYDVAPPAEAYPKAKAAAFKALEINPKLIEPRTTLAYVLATYEWNWAEAERQYRQVIETSPNYPVAHQWYGEILYATGRFAEAEIELKRAAERAGRARSRALLFGEIRGNHCFLCQGQTGISEFSDQLPDFRVVVRTIK